MLRAVDGYTVNISLADAQTCRMIVATHIDNQTTRVRHFDPICRPRWDAGVIQIKYLHALKRLFPSFCVVPIFV